MARKGAKKSGNPNHKAKPTYNHKLARSQRKKGKGATWQDKVRERERKSRG